MTFKEYKEIKANIERNCRTDISNLTAAYAFVPNDIEIGDIITCNGRTICVDELRLQTGNSTTPPSFVYRGVLVTKRGVSGKKGSICQSDMERELKQDD